MTDRCARGNDAPCVGPVRRYRDFRACDVHSPWAMAGRPRPPAPDPALTVDGLAAQARLAKVGVTEAEVRTAHFIATGIAGRRGTPAPTLADTRAQVVTAKVRNEALAIARGVRDQVLADTEASTDQEWRDACRQAIWHLATTRATFTTDDVWERLEQMGVANGSTDPRALGPVVMRALRSGAIRDTGRMGRSRRRHATKITIYERNPIR